MPHPPGVLPIKLDSTDPRRTFATCGPRDRAEFLAFRRWQGDRP